MPYAEKVCEDTSMAKSRKKGRRDELLDELLKEYGGSAGVTGPDGLLKDLTRAVVNRAIRPFCGIPRRTRAGPHK